MLVPLSWLGEMVELRGAVADVCALLTAAGIETEVAEDARPTWDGVVTARLDAVARHPNADKLTVCEANDGAQSWPIVCGASNHEAGDVVALAKVGTVLPGDFKIKKSKIRGEVSMGMLCSERELGISEEAAGILILPPQTPLGVPLVDVLSEGDVILEASAEANRGDCLSVVGLARELSAVTGWPLRGRGADDDDDGASALDTLAMVGPVLGVKAAIAGSGGHKVRVEVRAPDGCPRYTGAVMTDVKIGPSPRWMQQRLEAAGVRPISNVVDCTNYVMLELGNPLHAFDGRFIRGGEVVIRWAEPEERATTLDGAAHTLRDSDLVIADSEGVIALAGVMGGENSEVRDDTTVLFLESAHFDPASVRRTSHRCKLSSESSYRFARGVDPELPHAALTRLIELLEKTAGARLDGDPVDVYPVPASNEPVTLRFARVAGLLGMDVPPTRVVDLLRRAGLRILEEHAETVIVQPPSYRFDIEREVDLLEEIARLEGYDAIPEVSPSRPLKAVPRQPVGVDVLAIRRALVDAGLSEAIHFSFIDPAWVAALGVPEEHPLRASVVKVANPLSEVGGILRPTLLPSLLRGVARNLAMGSKDVRLFELRHTFRMRDEGFTAILEGRNGRPLDRTPAVERLTASGVLVGRRSPAGWSTAEERVDLFDVRGCVDRLEAVLGWRGWSWQAGDLPPFLDPREAATLVGAGGRGTAGWIGRIAVPVLRAFDLDQVVYAFELDIDTLASKSARVPQFVPFSRFPMVERDLAFVVPDDLPAGKVVDAAERVARKGMKDAFRGVEVFDVYRGKGVADGHRSLALRFRFRAPDRTLEDRAVDGTMTQVQRRLSGQLGIELRA